MKSIPMNPFSLQAILAAAMLLGPCLVAPAPAAPIPDPHETARIFDVCPEGCPFARIQDAVRAAEGASGANHPSVVQIAPGEYRENVTVTLPQAGTVPIEGSRIALIGASRDSVRIVGDAPLIPGVLQLSGGPIEVRDLTVINVTGSTAINVTAVTQANQVTIQNVLADCTATTSLANGCITWEKAFTTPEDSELRMLNNVIRFNQTGLFIFDCPGTLHSYNNLFEAPEGVTTGLGTMRGIRLEAASGTGPCRVRSFNDQVRMHRPNVATAVSTIYGMGSQSLTPWEAVFVGLRVELTDLGTSGANQVEGISWLNSDATSRLRCYECKIGVSRPNGTPIGNTRAIAQRSTVANQVEIYGGHARATNLAGTAVDLFQTSNGVLSASGLDFVTRSGTIAGFFPIAAVDAVAGCTANQFLIDNGGATRELCWCNAGTTQCVALGAGVVD